MIPEAQMVLVILLHGTSLTFHTTLWRIFLIESLWLNTSIWIFIISKRSLICSLVTAHRRLLEEKWGLRWWRHQMETFSSLLAICEGNSPVTGEFLSQRPVTRSFGVFFDLRLNKRLSKQSWHRWFETPSRSLWRHCNGYVLKNKTPRTCLLQHHPTRQNSSDII